MQIALLLAAPHPLTQMLLTWYHIHARPLPWRDAPEPYATWLSEVILQQTQVATGTAYWHRFLDHYPTVEDLASAPIESIMGLWKGLGYYSRARNLHAAARAVVHNHQGELPILAKDWQRLPGVGAYTAAAIASICHGEPVPVVDGNVQRVLARVFDILDPVDRKAGRDAIRSWSEALISREDPGSSNQAWMELGATVCKPKNPQCGKCPVQVGCLARKRDTWSARPVKQAQKPPVAMTVLFRVSLRQRKNTREWWIERRPERGIWGGMECFPATMEEESAPTGCDGKAILGPFEHALTHRKLTGWFVLDSGAQIAHDGQEKPNGEWVPVEDDSRAWPRMVEKALSELRTWAVKN
ncbi:MAG: A/G-specific adenine glycosylase [Crocinitomicaceae bacterium]|nr:A/G-specific adenine glycosylase [Crocinitomicaceae bacterium]